MQHEPSAQHGGTSAYYAIFAVLLTLTALTVGVAYVDLGEVNSILAVVIAITKASLVLVYFMHLRFSSRLTWLFASVGFFWFSVLVAFTIADEVSRGWLNVPGK